MMKFINNEIKFCHEKYRTLLADWDKAHERLDKNLSPANQLKLQQEYDVAGKTAIDFSRRIYAKTIYETYSKIKPQLVRVRTGRICEWNDVFYKPFMDLDDLEKSMLVALIEGSGGYKFLT